MPVSDYQRVGQAIEFIRTRAASQPSLSEVAGHVGLGPHHFQRLFSRWAGVSPKRFLQALTTERAKAFLRNSATVLDTTLEVGLSSQGRLHDLFVSVMAATPGQFKSRGRGITIRYGLGESPFGTCFAAVGDRGILSLGFLPGDDPAAAAAELVHDWGGARLVKDPTAAREVIDRVFSREAGAIRGADGGPLRLHLVGTNLQIQVWRALLAIPEGRVVSYGDLALAVGRPRAVRAIGSAVGRNPISWLLPCHRVLRASGALGGYRWGLARKEAMLAWESARNAGG